MIKLLPPRSGLLIAGLGLLATAGPTVAATAVHADPIGLLDLARVIGGLLVVVLAIVATAVGLKRLKSLHGVNGSHIKIIDGVSVSTRERIVLLEVDEQRVLVGVSPGRIQALHVFAAAVHAPTCFAEMVDRAGAPTPDGQL
ncbi:MAG: flagellar biosynthetic protein FliO [Proteobacteria bacterium]|nr:MAG: flagellar biosynthetic protein FliO [Pseudomonadota bacterium]